MTLLPLSSLVVWLAIDTTDLPRTLVPLCKLYFSWLYNWKPTPKTHSKLLAPSVSKCLSPLRLEYPFKGRFIEFLWTEAKNTLNHSNSLSALEQQREYVRVANFWARIKPTTLCSVIDKENLIEFLLDFLYYLYNYYMVCALLSHTYHVTHHVTVTCVTLSYTSFYVVSPR